MLPTINSCSRGLSPVTCHGTTAAACPTVKALCSIAPTSCSAAGQSWLPVPPSVIQYGLSVGSIEARNAAELSALWSAVKPSVYPCVANTSTAPGGLDSASI